MVKGGPSGGYRARPEDTETAVRCCVWKIARARDINAMPTGKQIEGCMTVAYTPPMADVGPLMDFSRATSRRTGSLSR